MTEAAGFTEDDVKRVQEQYKDIQNGPLSPTQAGVLLTRCRAANADPLAGHIVPQVRNAKGDDDKWVKRMVLVTTIDFLRLVADRTGEYSPGADTQFGAEWGVDDKKNYPGAPAWAKSFVRKFAKNTWHEYSAQAFFKEYVQLTKSGSVSSMWAKMPYGMLEKCAEAKALRRGFPNELQGLYSHEEMQQADNDADNAEPPKMFGAVPLKAAVSAQGGGQQSDPPPPVTPKPFSVDLLSVPLAPPGSGKDLGFAVRPSKQTDFPHGHNAPVDLSLQGAAQPAQDSAPPVEAPATPPNAPETITMPNPTIIPPLARPPQAKETISPKKDKCIGKPQRDRLWAIMKNSTKTKDDLKAFLKTIKTQDHPDGLESTNDIPSNIYEVVCAFIEGGK